MTLGELLRAASIQPTYEELKRYAGKARHAQPARIQPTYEELKLVMGFSISCHACLYPAYL